jgi:transcription-repair coupling factor (superfamily II helicase)
MSWEKQLYHWFSSPGLPCGSFRSAISSSSLLPVALTRIFRHRAGSLLVVVSDSLRAERLANSLNSFRQLSGEEREIVIIPEVAPGRQQWVPENEAGRCAALEWLLSGHQAIYLATAQVLLSRALSPESFRRRVFHLRKGEQISPEELARRLTEIDYDHEYEVQAPGEYARRGGIFDLYSPLSKAPVRIEFWGNEIDSLRFFQPDTQRSGEEIEELRIIPRGAAVLAADEFESGLVWDYFTNETPLIVCSSHSIEEHLRQFAEGQQLELWQQRRQQASQSIELDCLDEDFTPENTLNPAADTSFAVVSLEELFSDPLPELGAEAGLWRWQQLRSNLLRWQQSGYSLVACCAAEGEESRLRELLADDPQTRDLPVSIGQIALPSGLFFPEQRLVLLSDRELFGREPTLRRHKHIDYKIETSLRDYRDLEEGVLAVHVNHGICLYHGVTTTIVDGETSEVMELEFAGQTKLYLPLDQAQLLSRYMGGSKNTPSLSTLGGNLWKRNKDMAAEAAWDLAAELLRLEAMREKAKGMQFLPSPEWELSFASSFPHTETTDQTEAIEAVLGDMSSSKPMDRLLCGDVGYGKTEVALRAAFRTVMNARQVAILVPTTVLAQQHFQTFSSRMAPYPIRVELLSRFRSKAEQKQVVRSLAGGEVDIVIGTHRLLQADVKFSSLGLLIIDEEQRFGVKHKQKLKNLRASLDILTMTATPIPRTLYFSISGLRNLSTISTAPEDRLPVSTIVAHFDKELVRQALRRELERGGQSFFLHNRVQTIEKMQEMLEELLPEARIATGHGQMPAAQLEEVMTDFVAGKIDVLLCTTIIESGIDIPNANTIIIDHAERFGLSELYQLRGRVGRYHRQAYAYLLLPPMGLLPDNAQQRLAAIRRYSNLGAGFRLAMKDLEIRGAGNILGEEQSGHIAAVGFDLYCQLLRQAVAQLENKESPVFSEVPVEIELLSHSLEPVKGKSQIGIPPDYITDEPVRVESYKRLSQLLSLEEVERYGEELRDRFGPLPEMTKLLLELRKVRVLARQLGLLRLNVIDRRLVIETSKGLLKINGKIPELDGQTGAELVAHSLDFLKKIKGMGAGGR